MTGGSSWGPQRNSSPSEREAIEGYFHNKINHAELNTRLEISPQDQADLRMRNDGNHVMIIVLMGVSGSGKTTVGKELARQLSWTFVDADDFHPAANVEKMHRGEPLTDEDRRPWLAAVHERLLEAASRHEKVVLACSALKHAYQEYLQHEEPDRISFVYLRGSEELIRQRLSSRKGHFMNPNLLHSQFETLEPPENAVEVDIAPEPSEIAANIRRKLGL
jgi:gluconokinase